jgi:hypothetical protein
MKRHYFIYLLLIISLIACDEIINEENLENDSVSVLAPLDNTQVATGEVFFDWEPVEGARSYTIQVAQPDFIQTAQLLLQQTDSTTSASLNMTAGAYEWRIRAENDAYNSPYTTTSFTVQ